MEKAMIDRDFTLFRAFLVTRRELSEVNNRLSTDVMKNYVRTIIREYRY